MSRASRNFRTGHPLHSRRVRQLTHCRRRASPSTDVNCSAPTRSGRTGDTAVSCGLHNLGEDPRRPKGLMKKVVVTLRRRFRRQPVIVLLSLNQCGQIPAVLVDPMDCTGQVIHGLWLGDSVDNAPDGTTYCRVKRAVRRRCPIVNRRQHSKPQAPPPKLPRISRTVALKIRFYRNKEQDDRSRSQSRALSSQRRNTRSNGAISFEPIEVRLGWFPTA